MRTVRKLHNHKIISNLQDEVYRLKDKNTQLETIAGKGAELLLTATEQLFDYSEENEKLKNEVYRLKDIILGLKKDTKFFRMNIILNNEKLAEIALKSDGYYQLINRGIKGRSSKL